ncbi:hypothetical protein HYALB_00011906 [Hymenoscyphus albidus]|uniref:Heterokaryon incompatibility domain-containing protein n=1 Tax=Hymenoscyphus albidus TaxID=595503 RepID=A0A9N9LXE7_9HELO|nr:hypothetical protein HYALB_00011906 [Hymenoscyphus albidus]
MQSKDKELCLCTGLHISWNANTCEEARARRDAKLVIPPIFQAAPAELGACVIDTSVEAIGRSSNRGCLTCSLLYDATRNTPLTWRTRYCNRTVEIWYKDGNLNVHGGTGRESLHGKVSVDSSRLADKLDFREHCIAFPISKPYHKHTASEDTFKKLTNWIKECSKEHSCAESSQSILPERVVDIGLDDTTPKKGTRYLTEYSQFRRLRVNESCGQFGSYAVLGHCWGSSPIVTSVKSNFHDRKSHISWNELSKTFQDAVTITWKLGIPYLWIDSLCIIQGDPGDWEIQSSKMLSVYSCAYLTIAADHAENGDGGCFASSFCKPLLIRQIDLPETLQSHGTASTEWDDDCGLHPAHAKFMRPICISIRYRAFLLVDGLYRSVFCHDV